MRFEARTLKEEAEPVSARGLSEGKVYFSVQYVDEAMHVPIVEPLVFVGRNLNPGDEGLCYFQDAESHRRGVRYDQDGSDTEATFYEQADAQLNHIFEFEDALDLLLKCSLRRRRAERR